MCLQKVIRIQFWRCIFQYYSTFLKRRKRKKNHLQFNQVGKNWESIWNLNRNPFSTTWCKQDHIITHWFSQNQRLMFQAPTNYTCRIFKGITHWKPATRRDQTMHLRIYLTAKTGCCSNYHISMNSSLHHNCMNSSLHHVFPILRWTYNVPTGDPHTRKCLRHFVKQVIGKGILWYVAEWSRVLHRESS